MKDHFLHILISSHLHLRLHLHLELFGGGRVGGRGEKGWGFNNYDKSKTQRPQKKHMEIGDSMEKKTK